jgi:hypothetical protein
MAHDVFICHSSRDRTIANAICSKLEQNRIRCWIAPRDIIPGTDYSESIVEAISAAKLTVFVFSDHSNRSPHVHREIERTVSHGIPVLPFRVDDVVPSPSLEYFISDAHWLDAITPPVEQHLDQLVGTVRLLLERSGAAVASTSAAAGTATAVLEAPPAPPVPPAAGPGPRSRLPKWWRWAALAAAAVVAVVIVGVVAMGGGGKSGTTTPGSSSAPTSSASPPGAGAAKLGTTLSLTGMEAGSKAAVTATAVVDPATSTDDQPNPGDRFVAVQLRIRNTGSAAHEDSPDNCTKLVDASGREYEATTVLSVTAGPVFDATVTLKPGETASGFSVFEVPTSVKIREVRYTMDSGYADQTGRWSVG